MVYFVSEVYQSCLQDHSVTDVREVMRPHLYLYSQARYQNEIERNL
jgi:hypothetical protein